MSPPGPVQRPVDALGTLLADSLDAGYGDAARRGRVAGRAETAWLTGLGAFLIGAVLAVAFLHANRSAPSDARASADLRARVTQAESDVAGLSRTVRTLQSQVDRRQAAALGSPANVGLSAQQLQAGTTAVHGPGISVVLGNPPAPTPSDSTGRPGSTPIGAVSVLSDLDVRAIVNELWSLGAQAVTVNDERLTPTSTIRFAGLSVLVDFQPITAPYTISAIGDPDALLTSFTDSSVADRYRTLSSAYNFTFKTDQERDIVMAGSVLTDPRFAHVPSSGAPLPTGLPTTSTGVAPTGPTQPPTSQPPSSIPRTGATS